MRHIIDTDKARQIMEMKARLSNMQVIGKLITFEGLMKGNKRAGLQRISDVVVNIRFGKRGKMYHTAKGIKVPEALIIDIAEPTQEQIPNVDAFAIHEHKMDQMRELVGHKITWQSQKAGCMMTAIGIRCGKRRLSCKDTTTGMKWFVPLNLIRFVDDKPWSYKLSN